MAPFYSPLVTFFCLLLVSSTVFAAPTPEPSSTDISKRQAITTLSSTQISAFKPFTFFAAAAYCPPSKTLTWSCGSICSSNSGFQPVASGGDGGLTQFWFVGFDPSHNTVIVAHQGTNPFNPLADITDIDFFPEPLSQKLFPGIPSNIEVHNGFAGSHSRSAPSILAAVKRTLSLHPSTTSITVVGHSLGAALALLDGAYLPLNLPQNLSFRVIGYGMPRVGNEAFADYVDARTSAGKLSLTHINNQRDPVPIVPGRFLGFAHPSGEVHIKENGNWVSCPGQDNTSKDCIVGDEPNLLVSNVLDHLGPYDGVSLGICL